MLAPGLRAHQAHREVHGQDRSAEHHGDPPGTAHRSEPSQWRSRPLASRARARLTEFTVEAAPADDPRQSHQGENRQGHGRYQSARDAAGTEIRRQERQAPRDRPGRIRHRRQGRNRVGNRCRSRACAISPAKPSSQFETAGCQSRTGTVLTIYAWSRITAAGTPTTTRTTTSAASACPITNAPGRHGRSAAARTCATSSPFRATSASPAQVQTVFGYWRTTVPEWKAENDAIAAIWREYPEGSRATGAGGTQRRPARDSHSDARRFSPARPSW